MFTGIIEQLGVIRDVHQKDGETTRRITVGHRYSSDFEVGESVAVMGTCLTVVDRGPEWFVAEISPTTAAITTLARLKPGDRVNLERALTLASRLGGHLVQGHIDGVGRILAVEREEEARSVTIGVPPGTAGALVAKGSVAVDGVSLTIVSLVPDGFQVTLIAHTLSATTLSSLKAGDEVNVEFDVMAKYVERLAAPYLAAIVPSGGN